jgi:hypothetical protein
VAALLRNPESLDLEPYFDNVVERVVDGQLAEARKPGKLGDRRTIASQIAVPYHGGIVRR